MSDLSIAVLTVDGGGSAHLAAAAMRHPGIAVRRLRAGELRLDGVAGVVIDAPPSRRAELVTALLPDCRVPVLVEAPAATTARAARALAGAVERHLVLSLNPLRHALPTRRLTERMRETPDPLETFFAAWRFRPGAMWRDALPQLLDYVGTLVPGRPLRVSASSRRNPEVLLALLRYDSGVVGSLEVGGHLPADARADPELFIECFCRESVYHCWPGNQAVRVEGPRPVLRDWSPDPAEHMISVFTDAVRGRDAPRRSVADDAAALEVAEELLGWRP